MIFFSDIYESKNEISIFLSPLVYIVTCDVKPNTLLLSSFSKPFITEITVINIDMPRIIPRTDIFDIILIELEF